MRVRSIKLRNFKRFASLDIDEIPETTRLVVLAGPNGLGKSSLFDAFRLWLGQVGSRGWMPDSAYYDRVAIQPEARSSLTALPDIAFHGKHPPLHSNNARKTFYLRTAHRNDPDLDLNVLSKVGSLLEEQRPLRMNLTDAAVTANYQRLVSDAFDDVFESGNANTTLQQWRESVIGNLREAMQRLFPGLMLNGLGSPMRDPTFRFTKGNSSGFAYKNLSGGEKAAFDLVLDLIVKKREYDDTIFCIDEPEVHTNPRIHGSLLAELCQILDGDRQLWVATHSIGMLREARDMELRDPGSVSFLDFSSYDFDTAVKMTPTKSTRTFWERAFATALDDLAKLIAPSTLIVCEGDPETTVSGKNADHDARCYRTIFGEFEPDVAFVSGGNSSDVARDRLNIAANFSTVLRGTKVLRLIDRDDHAFKDVVELNEQGVRVLKRRNIESYLYDDEILRKLCDSQGKSGKSDELLKAKQSALARSSELRGNPSDNLKPAAPEIYQAAKRVLQLTGAGNDNRSFERNVLATIITPETSVYKALHADIFHL